ncbi:hypothetical protein TcasGA2_TC005559 [Tribolium castaneum]|uniref:Uncharacterized protein n=1 Tax=Tribolium castaneum TaxID=7070 RepID=D6WXI6_TRICA|nr:hypothetical protein TcasGA2_TC005559 [Tribolium castaneum]
MDRRDDLSTIGHLTLTSLVHRKDKLDGHGENSQTLKFLPFTDADGRPLKQKTVTTTRYLSNIHTDVATSTAPTLENGQLGRSGLLQRGKHIEGTFLNVHLTNFFYKYRGLSKDYATYIADLWSQNRCAREGEFGVGSSMTK